MEEKLSQRLIKARSGLGWSQADLAEVSGVAAAQISRYEAERSKPRMEVVAKLARAMGASFDWLAYGKGQAEAGLEIPKYPKSQKHLYTFDFEGDPDLAAAAEHLAQDMGLTIEMAIKTALLEYARMLRDQRAEGPAEPATSDAKARKPKP